MDRRIEEIREQLRQGRPMRVMDGRVKPEGRSASAPEAGDSPEDESQGVLLKPHDWGVL